MARDSELNRLKAEQDVAYQRQQRAYETMQAAWQLRSSTRDEMNRAFKIRQRAREAQDASWQSYRQIKQANGSRIDQLNAQQEAAYQRMRQAFENASRAHDRHEGAAARSYADDGHRFKDESRRYVEERRRLVAEIRSAQDRHDGPKAAFQRAKADFTTAKQRFNQAKAEHVRATRKRRQDDNRSIAEKAGVPCQYLGDLWVSRDQNGNANIYFGGVGKPDGPGHGHYVVDRNGKVTYRRDPFDPHGSQNFTDDQDDYYDRIRREPQSGDFGFWCRFRGLHSFVESNVNKSGREKIDIYYGPNGPFGPGRHHAVVYREDPYTFVYDEYRNL